MAAAIAVAVAATPPPGVKSRFATNSYGPTIRLAEPGLKVLEATVTAPEGFSGGVPSKGSICMFVVFDTSDRA
jgi:hypothetical protein